MSTFDLSAFAPARPAAPVHLGDMRREWADLMDQLLVQGKTIPDGKELTEEEKRHEIIKWESLTTRVVAAKDLGKSHPLGIKFTFPEDVYAAVAEAQKTLDKWKLELATVTRVKSGRKPMAIVVDDPPEPSTSRSTRPNVRPVVEIQVRNDISRVIRSPINQQNDPPCERCRRSDKCIGRNPGGRCNPCVTAKKKCSLSSYSRGAAAKAPGASTLFSAATKEVEVEVEVEEATPDPPVRTAKRKRSEQEGESKQNEEPLKRRIRDIEAELLQLSNSAHDISNKAHQLAVEIREMGESLGPEDRR